MPPANDNLTQAQTMTGNFPSVNGTTVGSTMEAQEITDGFDYGYTGDVWYVWTAPQTAFLNINLISPGNDGIFVMYTGDNYSNLSFVNYNYSPGTFQQLVTGGIKYHFQVTYYTTPLAFTLSATALPTPANDNYTQAQTLANLPVSWQNVPGTTVGATQESGELATQYNSVWYSYTAPSSGILVLQCQGSMAANYVNVYTGTALNNLVFVGGGASNVSIPVTVGVTYSIAVYSPVEYTDETDFILSYELGQSPPNDNFTQAQTITLASFPVAGNNTYATTEIGEPSSHYSSVWYSLTLTEAGMMNLYGGGNIAVYTGDILAELTPVQVIDGEYYQLFPFINYSICVYEVYPGIGNVFNLFGTFTEVSIPPNDNYIEATTIEDDSQTISGDNTLATTQLYETPTNYFSLWYALTPDFNQYITLSQTSGIPLNFGIYNGTDMQGATLIVGGNNSINIGLNAGVTYYISVSSQSSISWGPFSFNVQLSRQFHLFYTGPQTSPAMAYNSNGLNSIIYDPFTLRIYNLSQNNSAVPIVSYSLNQGYTFATDRTFPTLAASAAYLAPQAMFFDENGNLAVAYVVSQETQSNGGGPYNFGVSVRNKTTGIWTDYLSASVTMSQSGGGSWSTCWDFGQTDDGMIHFAQTYWRYSSGKYSNTSSNNIIYCNFKDGVFSALSIITQYGSNHLQSAGIDNIAFVNWQANLYLFWRGIIDGNNAHGNFNYCQIIPSAPQVMDAQVSTSSWITNTQYKVGDLVSDALLYPNTIFIALTNHTSGVFVTDYGNGAWEILEVYSTPTVVPALANIDVWNLKSDGTNIYFFTSNTVNSLYYAGWKLYQNFIDITPYTHPLYISGFDISAFEIAMNGDLVLYGFNLLNGIVIQRLSGVWQPGATGLDAHPYQNGDFAGGHTYNFANLD